MKKIALIMLIILLFPTCALANPGSHEVINLSDTTDSSDTIDVNSGLPVVSQDQLMNKANNMTTSIHQLAMKVSPQIAIMVLIACAIFGVFLKAARKMIIFVLIGLALIYWAPMLISLWTTFLQ